MSERFVITKDHRILASGYELGRIHEHATMTATGSVRKQKPSKWFAVHAGGIVWHGDHVHVAGTARGFCSFRLDDIVRVPAGDPTRLRVREDRVDGFGFRYLLPVTLIPSRLREEALHFGSGKETETICSSLLAEAFGRVDFPILPENIRRNRETRSRLRQVLLGRPTRRVYSGVLRTRHPSLCVPQDFDLSPYFDVVKFNAREKIEFDHKRRD